jgi:hypothetical protein
MRAALSQIEQSAEKRVVVHASTEFSGEERSLICYNDRGGEVKL